MNFVSDFRNTLVILLFGYLGVTAQNRSSIDSLKCYLPLSRKFNFSENSNEFIEEIDTLDIEQDGQATSAFAKGKSF